MSKGKTKICENSCRANDLFITPNNDPLLPTYRYKHQANSITLKNSEYRMWNDTSR